MVQVELHIVYVSKQREALVRLLHSEKGIKITEIKISYRARIPLAILFLLYGQSYYHTFTMQHCSKRN